MARRLAALLCLAALMVGLAAALLHDHVGAHPDVARSHSCLQCATALETPAEPVRVETPQQVIDELREPQARPFVRSILDPAHSGNAPPAPPRVQS